MLWPQQESRSILRLVRQAEGEGRKEGKERGRQIERKEEEHELEEDGKRKTYSRAVATTRICLDIATGQERKEEQQSGNGRHKEEAMQ